MSATTENTPSTSSATPGWLRRHRAALLITAALVVAAALSITIGNRSPYSERLDPGNPAPDGARAVARVLQHEGVDVDIVRDAAALDDAQIDGDTTVVVTSIGSLGTSTAERLLSDAQVTDLLLVDPPVGTLGLFDLAEGRRLRHPGTVPGSCADQRFDDLRVRVDDASTYPVRGSGCFGTTGGDALLVTRGNPSISVLGAGELLSNDQIVRADNAAVALRLLGQHDRLVWYVPDKADLTGGDAVGLSSLLPRWLGPGLWLTALAAIALAFWRGRRLGPLVTEPMPVAVTAIESTESRGRLYRKVGDRAHAAATLRRAARTRIADHLRLGRGAAADPETLIRDVATQIGLDPRRVRDLLSPDGPVPRTDKDLTQLANDLAELDREVRRP